MNTKYIYSAEDGITIGYQIDDEKQVIHYAIAYTGARDNFNKTIGRRIVDGRLAKGGVSRKTSKPNCYNVPFRALDAINYYNISNTLMTQAYQGDPRDNDLF